MSERFYITTPIYYPNGEPHLGHVYTTIVADTIARYHRLQGTDTFFLTGTDEHGIKMVKTAAEEGIEPRELADRNVAVFEKLWSEFGMTHDDFLRTSSDRHKTAVQEIVRRLVASDDIYLGGYEGWYDEGQEEFVTETEAKDRNFLAFNKKPLVRYKEPSYFFRLSKYAKTLEEYIETHPDFIRPESRRNEILSKLRAGVDDLSISRPTLKWGIQLPNDPEHVVYVWIDALSNYITALGYGSSDQSRFERYWPADVHLIGKEILWFHTVYWPAMLMALGIPLPKQVFAHGWWTNEGEKMSKTSGNFIDVAKLRELASDYSLDALRFYLLRSAPFGNDQDWKDAEFKAAYTELGNVLGNCLNRVLNMIGKYREGVVPSLGAADTIDESLSAAIKKLPEQLDSAYRRLEMQQCALIPLELARATNGFIDATAPFKLAKDPAQASRLDTVLHLSAQAIYASLLSLLPILPEKAAEGLRQMGIDPAGKTLDDLLSAGLPANHKLNTGTPLFPRIESAKN